MKTLQNDFTTPEQSKRLLELGIPTDSADCYWNDICGKPIPMQQGILYSDKRNQFRKVNVPVWSVGRLMEIIGICAGMECVDFENLAWAQGTWVEKIIILLQDLVKYDKIEFSKLED